MARKKIESETANTKVEKSTSTKSKTAATKKVAEKTTAAKKTQAVNAEDKKVKTAKPKKEKVTVIKDKDESLVFELDENLTDAKEEKTISHDEVVGEKRRKEIARTQEREEQDSFLLEWTALKQAKEKKTILRGKIVATKPLSDGSGYGLQILHNKRFPIVIPFKEIYKNNPIDMSTINLSTQAGKSEYFDRQRAMAEKLYGLEIPYIITDMHCDGKIGPDADFSIVASRKKAIKFIEDANFKPDKNGNIKAQKGAMVTGDIISVSRYSVQANICGVDTSIPLACLTYRPILTPNDVSKYFEVYRGEGGYPSDYDGDIPGKITVKIEEINNDKGNISMIVNHKPAELAQAKIRANRFLQVDMLTSATITNVKPSRTTAGSIVLRVFLDEYGVPAMTNAYPPSKHGVYPKLGDMIRVRIVGISEDGMVYVNPRGTHGSRPLFGR